MPTLEVVRKLAAGLGTTMASLMEELEAGDVEGKTEAAEPGGEKPPKSA